MLYTTHVVTSLLTATAVKGTFGLNVGIPYYVGTAIGSLLPDIDHPNSYIGKRSFGLATLLNKAFGHRGFTHSFVCTLLFSASTYILFPAEWAIGLSVGYMGHLLGDFFSKSGIPLGSPFTEKKYKIPIYKTGGLSESLILIISGLLLGWLTLL